LHSAHACVPSVTMRPMVDPVVTADGHTYERVAIEQWLQMHDMSPMTGEPLPSAKSLSPDRRMLPSAPRGAQEERAECARLGVWGVTVGRLRACWFVVVCFLKKNRGIHTGSDSHCRRFAEITSAFARAGWHPEPDLDSSTLL
jgi:hypothetical protein